ALLHHPRQVVAVDELGGDVHVRAHPAGAFEGRNRRVPEAGGPQGFALAGLVHVVGRAGRRRENLERGGRAALQVVGAVDDAHAALPEHLFDAVAAGERGGEGGRRIGVGGRARRGPAGGG